MRNRGEIMKKLQLGSSREILAKSIDAIKTFGLILTSVRVYSSGMVGGYFFDIDHCTTPQAFKDIGNGYLEKIQNLQEMYHIDKLAFLEKEKATIGAITFAAYLSVETDIPVVYIRLGREPPYAKGLEKGTGRIIAEGEHVVLIGDNTTLGDEFLKAADIIRTAGGSVKYAIVYTSRSYEGRKRLLENGIEVLYHISENELIEYGAITPDKVRFKISEPIQNIASDLEEEA